MPALGTTGLGNTQNRGLGGGIGSTSYGGGSGKNSSSTVYNLTSIHSAYIEGTTTYQISSAKNAYIYSVGSLTASRLVYLNGPAAQGFVAVYMAGISSGTISKAAYIYNLVTTSSSKNSFVDGWQSIVSSKRAYIFIATGITVSKPSFTIGHYSNSWNTSAFITAMPTIVAGENAYIVGQPLAQGNKSAFIDGRQQLTGSLNSYLYGNIYIINSKKSFIGTVLIYEAVKNSYIVGGFFGATASKKIYIKGQNKSTYFYGNVSAYINSVIAPITSSKKCFIYSSGVIGQWPLDDGKYDQYTIYDRDISALNNPGNNVNSPMTWVDGPTGVS